MADRFYTAQPLGVGEVALDAGEAHHLATVRRFAPGDAVTLFNGDGREYAAEVVSCGRKQVLLSVTAAVEADRELPFALTVAAALPKGDRAETMVEKLTELGVTHFVPLLTTRSVVVPRDATLAKLGRVVIEASKQCGRNRLMAVEPALTWPDFLAQHNSGLQLVLHTAPGGDSPTPQGHQRVTLAVGPEGGFTAEEVVAARAAGRSMLSLGARVLRVETAAIAAAAWAQFRSA